MNNDTQNQPYNYNYSTSKKEPPRSLAMAACICYHFSFALIILSHVYFLLLKLLALRYVKSLFTNEGFGWSSSRIVEILVVCRLSNHIMSSLLPWIMINCRSHYRKICWRSRIERLWGLAIFWVLPRYSKGLGWNLMRLHHRLLWLIHLIRVRHSWLHFNKWLLKILRHIPSLWLHDRLLHWKLWICRYRHDSINRRWWYRSLYWNLR